MPKKTSVEKAVQALSQAEVLQSQGRRSIAQSCKEIGVSEQPYYRRRKDYDGLIPLQAVVVIRCLALWLNIL